ncbi:MAG: NAD-dependent epimerase/dehydratase family protein [Maricaulis sp.]|nr:NAD-dependent epimerase/dehydratase family protein [Maricaulis sp.]MDM7984910.1 NAD-dependent epimerase/dehydratase family protein [Maricaulis sp.]
MGGGKEKAPAAMCRKVGLATDGGEIEVWGDGLQTRSFLYIDECLEGSIRLLRSDFEGPVNIGSEEMISINDLARMVIDISGKSVDIRNIPGPLGVRGHNSDNRLIEEKLGWAPSQSLRQGMEITYEWIMSEIQRSHNQR